MCCFSHFISLVISQFISQMFPPVQKTPVSSEDMLNSCRSSSKHFSSSASRNRYLILMGSCYQHGESLLFKMAPHCLRHRQLRGVCLCHRFQPAIQVAHRDVQLAGRVAHHRRPSVQPVCLRRAHEAPGGNSSFTHEPQRERRGQCCCATTKEEGSLPVWPAEKTRTSSLHLVCDLCSRRVFHPDPLPGSFCQ